MIESYHNDCNLATFSFYASHSGERKAFFNKIINTMNFSVENRIIPGQSKSRRATPGFMGFEQKKELHTGLR